MPRFRLFEGPSPFHRLERLEAALGGRTELWVKREDLLPLAFGGNKLRNLEFLVGAAVAQGADSLVTSGRRWSNHCRLTAAAGARAGLAVHLVLSGPPAPGAGHQALPNPGRTLDELLGATVVQLPTANRAARDAAVAGLVAGLRRDGRSPYVIPVGGTGLPGAAGQVLAGLELLDQAVARGAMPDAVVAPSATGGTQAGLLAGLRAGGSTAAVVGVLVACPDGELRPAIEATLAALAPLTGMAIPPAEIELDGSALGDGYGRPTAAAHAATELLARTEGLLVDPIYTAKALAALIAGVRSGRWDGRRVAFWHAGGTPGLFEPLDGTNGPGSHDDPAALAGPGGAGA
ncbi:MAG: pyridoxal-phosphate dependent enzyme [Chloroflexi bacterium]|nr:pyridoxal-phosphate dependent enzyme [Chloroflexota bacterium]